MTKLLRIHLPDELHARLKVLAAVGSTTMQNISVHALRDHMETMEKFMANPKPQAKEPAQ